jgi:serine protease
VLTLAVAIVVISAVGARVATPAKADVITNAKHFFWANGSSQTVADSASNDLLWHGGNAGANAIGVEQKPAVYLVFWGQEWADGFTTADTNGKLYSSKTLQNYVKSFFQNVGGSPWANIQTQYCNALLPGSTSCVGGAGFITNPKSQLKGTWTDSTPVPNDIIASGLAQNLVDDPIATEAQKAAGHFGYNPQATYIILTPPTAIIPWQNENWPGVGTTGCGMHNVNATSNAFGNGIFDGYSIVMGHEYAEAVTDPDNFLSDQDGWNDVQGSENGDKCAWVNTQNISLGGNQFAVQPLWSNEAYDATGNGCVVAR